MATFPYFVFGPNTVLSLVGLLRGPDRTVPTPREDWREATVDVIIPALNEERTIALCLASIMRQTVRPRNIVLIDDASTDRTVERAKEFCARAGMPLNVIQRRRSIGKTPTIKREARERDCDVEFVLDGDTVLESPDYIQRTVQELYSGAGIACVCGVILPMRQRDRRSYESHPLFKRFAPVDAVPGDSGEGALSVVGRAITNLYREVLYVFLQRFIYHGQMVFFGTISNPVGCAVAYRRKYVKDLFDYLTPKFGDDLTNSEDIFIGFALLNEGYRNVQLTDITARTVEPVLSRLPRQVYLWSSSFLQSCYYFDPLIRSPFKSLQRWIAGRRAALTAYRRHRLSGPAPTSVRVAMAGVPAVAQVGMANVQIPAFARYANVPAGDLLAEGANSQSVMSSGTPRGERRIAAEPYRQAFGRDRTLRMGRPAAWMLLTGALEKVFFPTALVIMLLLRNWHGVALTVGLETSVALLALVLVAKGERVAYLFKGLLVVPIRYALVAADLVTIGRFATDLWITQDRKWRK
jgi:glycosyltransferase involved in cell wall biosynthesis